MIGRAETTPEGSTDSDIRHLVPLSSCQVGVEMKTQDLTLVMPVVTVCGEYISA
jgi:hypothetical protein